MDRHVLLKILILSALLFLFFFHFSFLLWMMNVITVGALVLPFHEMQICQKL